MNSPAAEAADGPAIGSRLTEIRGISTSAEPWIRSFPAESASMLIFVSPRCRACNELLPHVHDFRRNHNAEGLVLVSTFGDGDLNGNYARATNMDGLPFFLGEHFAKDLGIPATPYALKVDKDGRVAAKGVVNRVEDLARIWSASRKSASAEKG